ncbi:MAG: selenide, water dikinase SelD [Anaerolineaceae bacterium]|nr:selenide, water dikinase SelD [Anaerolineaceae bacterium]
MRAETLAQVLRPIKDTFSNASFPDLLVGLDSPDDAAVWRLEPDRAMVITTDFFTPVVDDAYDYGAISAANSISDIYAMGGQPFLALNVAALPPDLPLEISADIIRGAAEKAHEAGVVIAGGHTIQDKEPKFGLVVVGFVNPNIMISKKGALPGDRLVLTKPLGFGVTTTALKQQLAAANDVREVVKWMACLNREASQLAVAAGVKSGTDVTGYSLLGHALEMASASGVAFRLHYPSIPFVSGARHYAEQWTFPGGAADNKMYFEAFVRFDTGVDDASRMLLFDPQTSGGLLLAVPPQKLDEFLARAKDMKQSAWVIGEVVDGSGIEVLAA